MRELVVDILRRLGSLKLAVVLLVLLSGVLLVAIYVDQSRGLDVARWTIYDRDWFVALFGLLAVNVLAALLVRFPWRRSQLGFAATHVGLLILLAGAYATFAGKIEGVLSLDQGETGDRITLRDRSCFRVDCKTPEAKEKPLKVVFVFRPGPLDWPKGETLDLGSLAGLKLKVLHFLAHAQRVDEWVADPADASAGREIRTRRPRQHRHRRTLAGGRHFRWASDGRLGQHRLSPHGHARAGRGFSARSAQRNRSARHPNRPLCRPHAAHSGQQERRQEDLAGRQGPVGRDRRIPCQRRANLRRPASFAGSEPKNPVLELRVHYPDKKEPVRQIAFAKFPFLNLDIAHGRSSPVTFWYVHPAVVPEPGVEFLTGPDGKLYCRIGVGGKYESRGEVKPGDRVKTWEHSSVSIGSYLPHALQKTTFVPANSAEEEEEGAAEAAAEIEITAGGASKQLWLQRSEASTPQPVQMPGELLTVDFGYDTLPLGFGLRLDKFNRQLNPGGMGDAAFTSTVQVVDSAGAISSEAEISMNHPLVHGKFAFYQSGMRPESNGTILTAAYDPGSKLKYLGSLLVCLGMLVTFCTKTGLSFAKSADA